MSTNDRARTFHQKLGSRSNEPVDGEQVTAGECATKLRQHRAGADGAVGDELDPTGKNDFACLARSKTFGGGRNGRTPLFGATQRADVEA
jgi:hypothetical protein